MAHPKKVVSLFSTIALVVSGAIVMKAQTARPHDPTKAETLVLPLLPDGFASRDVQVSPGLYLIDLVNRSTVRNLQFQIDKMPSTSLTDTPTEHTGDGQDEAHKPRFLKLVHLTPGTYRIQVAGHPAWVCAITVK